MLGVWAVLDKGRHRRRHTRGHDPGQYGSELDEMAQEYQNASLTVSHCVARNIWWRPAYLLAVAGHLACQDARLFVAVSCPWTSPSTFDTLREIE